jgi:DNA invertase Pin-like site-specific DNA recombinase
LRYGAFVQTTKTRRKATRTTGAITYRRVSTVKQVESGLGLEDQTATLNEWCNKAALPVIADLVDEGISGTTMNREGLTEALTMLSNGEASALVVKNTARLGRKTTDVLAIADQANREGWALVVVDIGLDTSTITGRLTLSLLAVIAEHEAGQISERTKAALAVAKAKGTVLGRPKTVSTQTIERIVQLRNDGGCSWRTIATQLNTDNTPTGQGGTWQANTCRRIYDRTLTAAA